MKKRIFRALAALTVTALLLSGGAVYALGEVIRTTFTQTAGGITIAQGVSYISGRQTERWLEYSPNPTVSPVVVYGSKVCNYGDFSSMSALVEKNGANVLAGMNGDYYVLSTYLPLGLVIAQGRLISSDAGHWAVGFREDGRTFIDKPGLVMKAKLGTETYTLGGINKIRNSTNYFLFTDEFSYTTKNTAPGTDIILRPPEGAELTVNCELKLTVEEIIHSEGAIDLPAGKMVLSLSDAADKWRKYGVENLRVGDTVTISVSSDEIWNEAEYAVGSLYKLVTDGEVEPGLDKGEKAPRSAVGVREDGTVILYTTDGRQSGYSTGLTIEQLGQRMKELGCVEATIMDGGASTSLHATYIGNNNDSLVNKPSGGNERSVSVWIMLAAKGEGSARMTSVGLMPFDVIALPGTRIQFTAGAADETGRPVAASGYKWTSSAGSVTESGLLTASGTATDGKVTASLGGIDGSARVTVVDVPDSVAVYNEKTGQKISSLSVNACDTVDLTAKAVWRYMDVASQDDCFTWSCPDTLGSIDGNGLFTAVNSMSSGVITVCAGGVSAQINETVGIVNTLLDGFETSASSITGARTEKDMTRVARGFASAALDYDLASGQALFNTSLNISGTTNYVNLWVYGDASGNSLYAGLADGGEVLAATLDYSGWKKWVFRAGADIKALILRGQGSGTIWIDHVVGSSGIEQDNTGPVIEAEVKGGVLTAHVKDETDGLLPVSLVGVFLDGLPLDFSYSNRVIKATLPDKEGSGRLTVRAKDISGNISEWSIFTGGADISAFTDMKGHWSEIYVNYLAAQGIIGAQPGTNAAQFNPGAPMTRAEFAAVICRMLRIDTAGYADHIMSFADLQDIPDYALEYVRALSALGVMKGALNGGVLYFMPSSGLTRQEAVTVIGRLREAGRAAASISDFIDQDLTAEWARPYFGALVYSGVIIGFEGKLMPRGTLTRAEIAKIAALVI